MAVTCARCGTQNPDGNRFCTNCGTALVPAASQGAPVAAPPLAPQMAPPPPQAGYQSPYYAPPPGGYAPPAVHRTPWVLIISVVVGMILVLSGVGTVLAFALSHHNTQGGNLSSSISSPSPLASPSPGQTPRSSPSSQPASGGQTVTTDGESVVVPSGWQVLNKDSSSVTLQDPDSEGALTIASGPMSPPQTAQQSKDSIDKQLAAKYPDTAACPGSGTASGAIAGVDGIFWTECFTLTSGGQSVAVAEPLWVGANSSGSVVYIVVLQTTQDNLESFIKACVPILSDGITWKLR